MKKTLLSILLLPFLVGCGPKAVEPANPDDGGQQGGGDTTEKVEYSKTDIVFGTVFQSETSNKDLTTLASDFSYQGVGLSFKQGTGSNPPLYHVGNKEARLYRYNTVTISKKGMTKINFVFSGSENGEITASVGKYVAGGTTTGKWTGEADSITFTISSGQRRALSLSVICGDDPNEEESPYPEDTNNSYTVDFEHLGLTNSLQESQKNFNTLMMGYIGKERTEVSSLSNEGKVQIYHKTQTYNDTVYEVLALQVGSANDSGSLTINFSKELKTVKLYSSPNFAFAYDRDSGTYVPSCDGYCRLTVNNEEWVLGSYDATVGVTRSEKEFTINSNSLTLSGNASERVYTYAMTFTF